MLYRLLLRPLFFRLPPETAHEMALHFCRTMMRPRLVRKAVEHRFASEPFMKLERFGLKFSNPVGLGRGL